MGSTWFNEETTSLVLIVNVHRKYRISQGVLFKKNKIPDLLENDLTDLGYFNKFCRFERLSLTTLVLVSVVAATAALPQQQNPNSRQEQQRRLDLQRLRAQGDIDAIPSNLPLKKLTKEDLENFFNNPKSVNILTQCFVEPTKCKSASAYNIMDQMNSLTVNKGQCQDCTPEEKKWLDELMYILVQGFTSRYTEQWLLIYPQVKVLVAAAAAAQG